MNFRRALSHGASKSPPPADSSTPSLLLDTCLCMDAQCTLPWWYLDRPPLCPIILPAYPPPDETKVCAHIPHPLLMPLPLHPVDTLQDCLLCCLVSRRPPRSNMPAENPNAPAPDTAINNNKLTNGNARERKAIASLPLERRAPDIPVALAAKDVPWPLLLASVVAPRKNLEGRASGRNLC